METVTISPKFQVVIPKTVRDAMGLRPGQKMQAIQYGDRVELIPLVPVSDMRGMFRGIDTTLEREDDRL